MATIFEAKNMPLFPQKFVPKTLSKRKKSRNEVTSTEPKDEGITLKLDDLQTTFHKGKWIQTSGPASETNAENSNLKRTINDLEEENNLLKLKNEILLDMLAQNVIAM